MRGAVFCIAIFLAPACMRGPSFFKQSGSPPEDAQPAIDPTVKIVETTKQAGAATGFLSASEQKTQVIKAPEDSPVAGSQAAFPPGALAIDTEITIGPGDPVATQETIDALKVTSPVVSSGQPVAIQASVPMDTQTPFTLQLPLPNGAALTQDTAFTNLIVMYEVRMEGEKKVRKGLLPRNLLQVDSGFVVINVKYFGTYQAVITKDLIEVAAVVDEPDEPIVENPVEETPAFRKIVFRSGPRILSSGGDVEAMGASRLWGLTRTPTVSQSINGTGESLISGVVVQRQQEDSP